MNTKSILTLAAASLMLAACQSNSYKITGTIEGSESTDTLFLTTDLQEGIPCDTIVAENGKFSYKGTADSVSFVMIYSMHRHEINAQFFIEPGEILVNLSDKPGTSRVGGTKCNDLWQEQMDSVIAIGREINRIAENIYGNTLSPEEMAKGEQRMEELNRHFSDFVKRNTKKNIKNEFGFFLLTNYPDEVIDNDTRLQLIQELPDDMRQRPVIKAMEEALREVMKTAEGTMMPAFSQPTPDGAMLNIKDEIAKNKLTIIDFWASWCGPCRQEMPFMIELYNEYKDRGLGIVGVSLDQDHDAWTTAISRLKMPWPQMSDLKGWENAAAQLFNIHAIPHTIVVDRQGKILHRGLRGEELRETVKKAIAAKP